ncbi:unnamed protein product [Ostreobium quekettii]|uniref:Uncharacterized protein n=1 Tax=Ostreobium quekettii TaxID=121088 RepID=A0A8S1J7X3_9CHLO|nr:unnamed protein product [Ostreobium quekettii]
MDSKPQPRAQENAAVGSAGRGQQAFSVGFAAAADGLGHDARPPLAASTAGDGWERPASGDWWTPFPWAIGFDSLPSAMNPRCWGFPVPAVASQRARRAPHTHRSATAGLDGRRPNALPRVSTHPRVSAHPEGPRPTYMF